MALSNDEEYALAFIKSSMVRLDCSCTVSAWDISIRCQVLSQALPIVGGVDKGYHSDSGSDRLVPAFFCILPLARVFRKHRGIAVRVLRAR